MEFFTPFPTDNGGFARIREKSFFLIVVIVLFHSIILPQQEGNHQQRRILVRNETTFNLHFLDKK
jgi:hypothetical protein